VYVEVPIVACSSIKIVLARLLNVDLVRVGDNPHQASFPQPPPGVLLPRQILAQAPDFTEFHPSRRVAFCLARFSAFQAGMSFEQYVEAVSGIPDVDADGHFRN
jgi:hypothetical protein